MASFNWNCPHCGRAQTVVEARFSCTTISAGVTDVAEGSIVLERTAIGCANPDCKKITLSVQVGIDDSRITQGYNIDPRRELLLSQRLLPRSSAKSQPAYIPSSIVDDYTEACLICDLSPKAAATL